MKGVWARSDVLRAACSLAVYSFTYVPAFL